MNTDILILGSGASGMQAAIYVARRQIKTIILGKLSESSLMRAEIENYFGFSGKISGKILLNNSKISAQNFGVEFVEQDAISVEKIDDNFCVTTENDEKIFAKAIIIATGVSRKTLNVKGEKEFVGKGVSYCTDCDGMFFKNKNVAIVGDGSSATHSVNTMSKIAQNVTQFRPTEIVEIQGSEFVEKIILKDGKAVNIDGVFIELGAKGAFDLFQKFDLKLDESLKHIQVDKNQKTNIAGIFACGDITGLPYQVAVSVGEGATAGISASEFVKHV